MQVLEVDRQGRVRLSIKETSLHRTAKLRFGYYSLTYYTYSIIKKLQLLNKF